MSEQVNPFLSCLRRVRYSLMYGLLTGSLALTSCQPIVPPTPSSAVDASPDVTATTSVTVTSDPVMAAGVTETAALTASLTASHSASIDPALVAAGMAVYRQHYCGICHALTAVGTLGSFGPPHDGMGSTAEQRIQAESYSGNATSAAEYILESLLDPQIYIVGGYAATPHRMPPYGHLDSASLDALVAFLLAQ